VHGDFNDARDNRQDREDERGPRAHLFWPRSGIWSQGYRGRGRRNTVAPSGGFWGVEDTHRSII
jgi:hypothetical protein